MLCKIILGALAAVAVTLSTSAFAQAQYGTAGEAKAMLERAIAAVKADKDKALAMFNKGEGGFKDRDLQPFCFNISDGKILASTNQAGKFDAAHGIVSHAPQLIVSTVVMRRWA